MNIEIDVPDGTSGDWSVSTFTVTEKDARFENMRAACSFSGRWIMAGTYKRLMWRSRVVMSNTPAEIGDHYSFIHEARRRGGHILINGLGLGACLKAVLESNKVERVTVIERSPDVIKLVAPTHTVDDRVQVIEANAYTYMPPKGVRYTTVWHDVWDTICADNLPGMHRLHRKYGRRTDWQGSWARELIR